MGDEKGTLLSSPAALAVNNVGRIPSAPKEDGVPRHHIGMGCRPPHPASLYEQGLPPMSRGMWCDSISLPGHCK